jgi:hypothetical protein
MDNGELSVKKPALPKRKPAVKRKTTSRKKSPKRATTKTKK